MQTMLGALSMATGILAIFSARKKQYHAPWDRIADSSTHGVSLSDTSVLIERALNSMLLDCVLVAMVLFVLVGILALFQARQIMSQFNDMAHQIFDIANGHIRIPKQINLEVDNELGAIATQFNRILNHCQKMTERVAAKSQHATESSEAVIAAAANLVERTNLVSSQSCEVVNSVHAISERVSMLASVSERVLLNCDSIGISIEELDATVRQLHTAAEQASMISIKVENLEGQNQSTLQRFRANEQQIGSITDLVKSLHERIHVLALNATLEATRAGGAGSGLSVVAEEAKQLAKQTTRVAEAIVQRERTLNEESLSVHHCMANFCCIVQDFNSISASVTSIVEEQSRLLPLISETVRENIAYGNSATSSIAHASTRIEEISLQINRIIEAMRNASQDAETTRSVGFNLRKLSESFQSLDEQLECH